MNKKELLNFIDVFIALSFIFMGACTLANMIWQKDKYIFALFVASAFISLSFSLIYKIINTYTTEEKHE